MPQEPRSLPRDGGTRSLRTDTLLQRHEAVVRVAGRTHKPPTVVFEFFTIEAGSHVPLPSVCKRQSTMEPPMCSQACRIIAAYRSKQPSGQSRERGRRRKSRGAVARRFVAADKGNPCVVVRLRSTPATWLCTIRHRIIEGMIARGSRQPDMLSLIADADDATLLVDIIADARHCATVDRRARRMLRMILCPMRSVPNAEIGWHTGCRRRAGSFGIADSTRRGESGHA